MSKRVWFSPQARTELDGAIAWYERKQPGVGAELEAELNLVLEVVAQRPERFSKVTPAVRKARLHKFRYYAIYFMANPERIDVIAVHHGKRDPDELRRRLG